MMVNKFLQKDKIIDLQCGQGHSLAITQRGRIYSWGEAFYGQLGLGYADKLGRCLNQNYPKQITKNLN
jgi:alpha-tubulin suppressor-like RCC1 family protein